MALTPYVINVILRTQLFISKIFDLILRLLGPALVVFGFGLVFSITFLFFTIPLVPVNEPLVTRICISALGVLLLLNAMFNWVMCIFTPPGTPPHDGVSNPAKQSHARANRDGSRTSGNTSSSSGQSVDVVIDIAERGELLSAEQRQQQAVVGPICKSCKGYKPARVHHCSVCNKCVKRMDHHCPWMCNCIGFDNYRYFVLFLVYMFSLCLFCVLVSLRYYELNSLFVRNARIRSDRPQSLVLFVFFTTLSVGGAVLLLLVWHLYLIISNQTTIEFYQNRSKMMNLRRGRAAANVNKFDLGTTRNWRSVFGSSAYRFGWLLPSTAAPDGDGMHWPTSKSLVMAEYADDHVV